MTTWKQQLRPMFQWCSMTQNKKGWREVKNLTLFNRIPSQQVLPWNPLKTLLVLFNKIPKVPNIFVQENIRISVWMWLCWLARKGVLKSGLGFCFKFSKYEIVNMMWWVWDNQVFSEAGSSVLFSAPFLQYILFFTLLLLSSVVVPGWEHGRQGVLIHRSCRAWRPGAGLAVLGSLPRKKKLKETTICVAATFS